MKILKPGKVEIRKFVCPNCECEFVIYKSEADRAIDSEANYHYWAKCPCRDQIAWEKGEPYKEPTQDDAVRLYELMKESWPHSIGELSDLSTFLAAYGVTFREE